MYLLPERLRELRKAKNVLQKDVAAAVDTNERNYRRYENSEVDPPTRKAVALADYFGVSLDYLVGRRDEP